MLGAADEWHVDLAALERLDHAGGIVDRHEPVRDAETTRELDADIRAPPLELPVLLEREIRQHQHADTKLAARRKLPGGLGGALRAGAGGKAEDGRSSNEYGGGRQSGAHFKPLAVLRAPICPS